MKYSASVILLLVSMLAIAAPARWVQIGDGVGVLNAQKSTTQTQVYLDEANLISEDNGFQGYTIRFILPAPVDSVRDDKSPFSYQIVETILEYNCTTQAARGKRTNLMSMAGETQARSKDDWREIPAGTGAAAMLAAVKARVCR